MPPLISRACSHLLLVIALSFSAFVFIAASSAQDEISDQALSQINALIQEKQSRNAAEQKMDSHLVMESKAALGKSLPAGVPTLRSSVQFDETGLPLVNITADVSQELVDYIEQLGGHVISSVPKYDSIHAAVPAASLELIANLDAVRVISTAFPAITNMTNVSEGVGAHNVAAARTAFSVDGTGVNIGVLSDGVDSLATAQGTGDLPPGVTVLSGQAGSGDEGTAMLEIVNDVAPGATLFFAEGLSSQAQFAQNILDLRTAGCDIIVDDIAFFAEPVFEDGIIAQAAESVISSGGVYFSSAGNSGNLNDNTSGVFEGDYSGIALPAPLTANGLSAHDFGGMTNANLITVDSPFGFSLHWSDLQGASANDYDLFLLDNALTTVVDFSNATQNGTQNPFEFIGSNGVNHANNQLVVVLFSGSARYFHLNTIRGQLAVATAGQTAGHPAATNVFGVAAVDVASAPGGAGTPFNGTEPVETFSSDGPRRIFFSGGAAITPGDFSSTGGAVLNKPDIAAADGVMTSAPGFNPFFGTSAAAPHAAALAALIVQAGQFTTTAQLRTLFNTTSIDIEAAGFDRDSGAGIVNVGAALTACNTPPSSPSALVASDGTFTDRVRVQWTAVPGASGYRVFRTQNAILTGATDISGVVTGLQFDDTTATTGGGGCNSGGPITYFYFAVAVNACGNSGISPSDSGAIDGSKSLAAFGPSHVGDFGLLVIALAGVYLFRIGRKRWNPLDVHGTN